MKGSSDFTVANYLLALRNQCGGNAKKMLEHYTVLTDNQKTEFAALPVQEQIDLLCVPVRAQKRYKTSGITAYVEWTPAARVRVMDPKTKVRENQAMRSAISKKKLKKQFAAVGEVKPVAPLVPAAPEEPLALPEEQKSKPEFHS